MSTLANAASLFERLGGTTGIAGIVDSLIAARDAHRGMNINEAEFVAAVPSVPIGRVDRPTVGLAKFVLPPRNLCTMICGRESRSTGTPRRRPLSHRRFPRGPRRLVHLR